MYTVYKHTSPNGKIYIGVTSQRLSARFGKNGSKYEYNKLFYEDILNYGWNNIKHEVILETENAEEAHDAERKLIAEYHSNNIKYGYNLSIGGGGGKAGYGKAIFCIETGEQFDMAKTAEEKTGISRMHIGACCRNERITAGGFHWAFVGDENADKKLERAKRKRVGKMIQCIETGETFTSRFDACAKTGLSIQTINRGLAPKGKYYRKMHFKYFDEVN